MTSYVRRTLVAVVVAAISALTFALPAFAGTDTYCLGCTIGANTAVENTNAFFLTLDYVHRLSGPSCSTIGAYAHYTDGTYGSEVFAYCTDAVQHGYNGSQNGWGAADNAGAGNYGFNAHVDY